ncbi:MAG: hypothetical protein VZR27_08125, partial [Acutalibacteraceae bacterium]|nr:hypothetical protein [Acutalibacteraceae bacterium]
MEEQGKINFPVENQADEAKAKEEQTAERNGENVSEVNPPGMQNAAAQTPYAANMGMNNPYGAQMRAGQQYPTAYGQQMPAMPYQTPYAQGYPQQPVYRAPQAPAAYPAQQPARPYTSFQQNAPGTGPGQYNYKASMTQHNAGGSYTGAGPGQYDFRSATPNTTMGAKPQTVPQTTQQAPIPYGYNSFGQYPGVYNKPQTGSGYGYYQQQYPTGYPSQFSQPTPAGQPFLSYTPQYGYGNNMYNQQRPVQPGYPAANRPNTAVQPGVNAPANAAPNGANVASLQKKTPAPEPAKEEPKKAPEEEKKPVTTAEGDEYREIVGPDGQKIRVKRVAKEPEPEPVKKADGPSKFIQEQIKAEMGGLREGEEPIIQYKSNQKKGKKKSANEGQYKPGLKDMILGPPKKDKTDKAADLWEWKCPQCGTVNSDYTSTCQCGCTQQRAKAIARDRVINENIRENNPIPGGMNNQQRPMGQNVQQGQNAQQRPMGQNAGNQQAPVQPITMQQRPQADQKAAQNILTSDDMIMSPGSGNDIAEQPVAAVTQPETATKIEEPIVQDDYDPEMPEKVELTEEQIQAEIDEWMNQPIQVWRPKSQKEDDKKKKVVTEIYLTPQKAAEQKDESSDEKKPDEKAEEKKEEKISDEPKKDSIKLAEKTEKKDTTKEKSDVQPAEPDGLINDNEWKCSNCENINPISNDTCKCGHKRGKKQMSYEDILRMTRQKPLKKNEKNDDKPAEKLKTDVKVGSQLGKAVPTGIITQTAAKGLQGDKMIDNQKPTEQKKNVNYLKTEEKIKAEAEAKRKAEEEAKRKAEEEAKRKAEEEAKRKAELEARIRAEEEARIKAEMEAKRKAEEEARRKAEEEARRKAEEEARRKAEEEARRKAEEEARRKAEEEARRKAEEEARRKAEEEARRKAEEEARRKAEEEARRNAEDEARR